MTTVFGILSRFRFLRGTALDPFGYAEERRTERRLIDDFRTDLSLVAATLEAGNAGQAEAFLSWPMAVRGFGHVKAANLTQALASREAARAAFLAPEEKTAVAAQ